MRRSIKKAVAFTLAAVTMAANLSVSAPVKAAEYDEVKEVLPNEYDWYCLFGDGVLFYKQVELEGEEMSSSYAVSDMVVVDKNGEKSSVNVKNSDGTYKFESISPLIGGKVSMNRGDGTYAYYYEDGTWFGDGKDKYTEIMEIYDNNYLVQQDGNWNIVDKSGKVLGEKICTIPEGYRIDDVLKVGEYIVIKIWPIYSGGLPDSGELVVLDKNYKKVSNVDLSNYRFIKTVGEGALIWGDEELFYFDSKFDKKFTYKREIVKNPSPSAENTWVWYYIDDVSVYEEVGAFSVSVTYEYVNPSGVQMFGDEIKYYDLKTFNEISEDKVINKQETEKVSKIENTDLTYKNNDSSVLYYGEKKVTDFSSIMQYVCEKRSASSCSLYFTAGYNGDLYIKMNASGDCTVVLEKASGYSLDKAKILDLNMRDAYRYLGGCIVFGDGTAYFNGKVYDKISGFEFFTEYSKEEEKHVGRNYIISQTEVKGDKTETVNTLYDKYHTEIYKTKEDIWYVSPRGIMVTCVEDESENYKLGCKLIEKTLVSSEDILDELVNAEEGEIIEVEIKKNDPIKAEVFEAIKGKDIDVVLKLDNGMAWKVNGKDVNGKDLTDINLTVDVVKDVVPAAAINAVKLKGDRIELSLAHTGEFGFSAELTMNVKIENAGKYANRFYYNPETKALEFQEAVKIDMNGDATFTYTHASDYVIILSDVAYDDSMAGKPGDMANIGMLVALLGVAGGAMFVMQKRKMLVK